MDFGRRERARWERIIGRKVNGRRASPLDIYRNRDEFGGGECESRLVRYIQREEPPDFVLFRGIMHYALCITYLYNLRLSVASSIIISTSLRFICYRGFLRCETYYAI